MSLLAALTKPNAVHSRRTKGADVGSDEGTPVTEDYQVPFKFTGKIDKVTIDLKEMTRSAAIETGKARQEAVLRRALSD
jgi:arylsulfatase